MSTAGVLLFINNTCGVDARDEITSYLNHRGRVSEEVLQLYWVRPTRNDLSKLCEHLHRNEWLEPRVELLPKLRPNNGLRDLTAYWRLSNEIKNGYHLLVGLETVNPEYRRKYPIPNLTLQAGSIENNETIIDGALREMQEEANIHVNKTLLTHAPIKLLRGGMWMFPCFVNSMSQCTFKNNKVFINP